MQDSTYTIDVQEDENGELFIALPQEILETLSWKENDQILWQDNKDGSWSLTKKES
jgi:hypothetical protein